MIPFLNRFFARFRNKILIPLRVIPKDGLPKEKIAMTLAIGVVSGLFPIIGLTTAVCVALLLILRQNYAIGQAVNWILAPIHLLLIIPFMRLGAALLGYTNVRISLSQIILAFEPGIWSGLKTVGIMHLYGALAWSVVAVPAGTLVYFLVLGLLRLFQKRKVATVRIKSN